MKTFLRLVFAGLLLPGSSLAQTPEPEKKIPADSVEIATTGCLKGRVFTATQPREDFMRRGPNVTGRSFRLNGPRAVIDVVKTHDGDHVEIIGLVRRNDLRDNAPGARIGNTRVVIGAPRSSAATRRRPTSSPSAWSCRPIASPACGATTSRRRAGRAR